LSEHRRKRFAREGLLGLLFDAAFPFHFCAAAEGGSPLIVEAMVRIN
jgi:hypothetical protein